MSETSIYSGDSAARSERRRVRREPPSSLVYVDVGPENGGVVTDLSEEGAGVQAVAPLQAGSRISVQFDLAGLQTRIKTDALVTWVSDSRRHAGLQFVDFAAEVRAQVRGWLKLQHASPRENEKQRQPPPESKPARETSAVGKWTNLTAGAVFAEHDRGAAARTNGQVPAPQERPAARDIADKLPRVPNGVYVHGFLRDISAGKQSAQNEPSTLDSASKPGFHEQREQAGAADALTRERAEVIRWPSGLSGQEASSTALSKALPPDPETRLLTPSPQETGRDRFPDFRATPATASGRFWKPAALAICLAAVLLGAFGAGRWLATPSTETIPPPSRTPERDAQTATLQNQQTATITSTASTVPNVRAHRKKVSRSDSVFKEAVPLRRPVAGDAVPTANPAPVESAPPVHVAAVPVPTLPSPAQKTNSAQVPAQANTSAPTIVDGRVLTETDRFNPAHLIYRFSPDYPEEAKEENVEGTVVLHIKIDANGSVQEAKVASGPPALVSAAITAVRNWRYLPALLNGNPVTTEQDVRLDFHLPR